MVDQECREVDRECRYLFLEEVGYQGFLILIGDE